MYAYGYKHTQQSKETLLSLELKEDMCVNCDECLVGCPSRFEITQKIATITPVMQIPNEFLT